jgi:bifunctional non-homologous end joining protein LigD
MHVVVTIRPRLDWSSCLAFAARPDANESTPVAWSELSVARPPDRFSTHTVPERLRALRADPWREYHSCAQQIPRDAVEAFERL